jgi:hypothetical protein
MAMPHRLNLRRPSLLPEVGTIAAALAAALFLVLYGPPAQGAGRSGKQGDILTVEFAVIGIPCIGLDGGPHFRHSEAFSFQVAMDDQAETDRLWNAIVSNGGQARIRGDDDDGQDRHRRHRGGAARLSSSTAPRLMR